MSGTGQRYTALHEELAAACAAAGRLPGDVQLVCVSKTASIPEVQEAFAAGARIFGENRIESLMQKAQALPEASWHFIGNIQSRKIRDIVAYASLIHSVWREGQLPKIDRAAAVRGKVQDILVEVNVSGEQSKDGLAPADVPAFVALCEAFANLRVRGLMTMAPQGDAEAAKAAFAGLAGLQRSLIEDAPARADTLTELSMGMSEDWKYAVSAGSTMVRLGRAVFSPDFC